MYILKIKNKKKISRFPNLSQKKRKIFPKKKSLWTRGIEPLSHLKKKKKKNFFGLRALDFLVTFSKKAHFFSFKDFKIL